MARKSAELVQVKLRMPEYLRRQVLAAAKKSGRSLSGEINYLIEEGLIKPEYEKLIRTAAETASIESATRMTEAIKGALAPTTERTTLQDVFGALSYSQEPPSNPPEEEQRQHQKDEMQ
jgi:hypothetical protein